MDNKIVKDIIRLKKEKKAVLLVHAYQLPEVQEIGDYVGDSLGLCIEAAKTDARVIVFCGVYFMAESAKILNPEKTVLLPDKNAGCPMADMAEPEKLRELKSENPGAVVVCYVNSTAAVKAESDICCTSSNAEKIIRSIPEEKRIIFVPDRHLGSFAAERTGRDIILWPGFCPTHQRILPEDILRHKKKHPEAMVLVHPECSREVRGLADFVGSTRQIHKKCIEENREKFIIATEQGIIHGLEKETDNKHFIPASKLAVCPNMKKTNLENIRKSLELNETKILINSRIMEKALIPIKRMMEIS